MVHGEYRVGLVEIFRYEQRIRRQRSGELHALGAQSRQDRLDDVFFFATEMPVFAGMWIQAAYENARRGNAKTGAQIMVHYAQDVFE